MLLRTFTAAFLPILVSVAVAFPARADRSMRSLNGPWEFQREGGGNEWRTIELPCSFEEHAGIDFDDVGVYRKRIPPFVLADGMRAVIHFQAVATLTTVSFNGQQVGTHLGGWTPFRIDVTDLMRATPPGQPCELLVRVDEKVGHNSQGFMPVFAPHFGGIWQDIKLLIVPEHWMDDTRVLSVGNPETGALQVEIPVRGVPSSRPADFDVRYRILGSDTWSAPGRFADNGSKPRDAGTGNAGTLVVPDTNDQVYSLTIPLDAWKWWSPESPNLYELEIRMSDGSKSELTISDRIVTRAAFRSMQVDGHRLMLNGNPLSVRGILNWGYAPPRVAPSIDESHMRTELELARSLGFNLMKFCLWVPPKRYFELADEIGMLTWIEYPTWHSKWTPDQLPTLEKEFTEFFCYDRNHPSVVLRSLTCETGTSADLGVIRALYDRCHAMIPSAVVEDDSSWIGWNRIHDFYDDHPYGNNHTWIPTLEKLRQHIAQRTPKPLVLGEAIAADTWFDRQEILNVVRDDRPFWLPRFFDGNQEWTERMQKVAGAGGLEPLVAESKHYALLMRKYQIEAYRREVPFGGYVVSVIRDIPLCSMGLVDYLGRPKWSADDWNWHGETMLLLETEADRRSFAGGKSMRIQPAVSHFSGTPIENGTLTITIESDEPGLLEKIARKSVSLEGAGLHRLEPLEIVLPDVAQPLRFKVEAQLAASGRTYSNHWPMWLVPTSRSDSPPSVRLHNSCPADITGLFPSAAPLTGQPTDELVIATRLDVPLLSYLESGGRVLVLPDGQKGSFPLTEEWFLRGAPYIADHPLLKNIPRQLLVELQHFDLASAVIPDISYLEEIDPIVMLWNNHDLDKVKTQGLVFETRIGRGRLLVSALRHTAATNAAGSWLAHVLLSHLATGPSPKHALSEATIRAVKEKLDEERIDLTGQAWQFRPDPENNGLDHKWQLPTTSLDDSWKPIHIGQAWEGQGYPTLDGWAWYRIDVDIPQAWKDRNIYVSFEGADDYYELFVNGQKVGTGGDIETKTTAFEERKSHDVTRQLKPGETAVLAVRIYDWDGAGGLFRPITIGTAQIDTAQMDKAAELLK